jgi:hypothetical protein
MTNSAILDDGFCLAVDQVQHKDRRSRQMLPVGRSDVPALLPAALVSIQKGQPANSATRRQPMLSGRMRSMGVVFLSVLIAGHILRRPRTSMKQLGSV